MPALIDMLVQHVADPSKTTSFEPAGAVQNNLAVFAGVPMTFDDATGQMVMNDTPAVLQTALTVSNSKPSKTSRISKSRVKLVQPKPTIQDGLATNAKDRETTIDFTIMSSERATPLERAEAYDLFLSVMAREEVRAVFVDNKSFW